MKRGSAGGQVMAVRQRKEALMTYYQNPNRCLYCGNIIEVLSTQKVCDIRKKKFCNQSCNAKYQNSLKPKREKKIRIRIKRERKNLLDKTKKDILEEKHDFHASIRGYARSIYFKKHNKIECEKCGYTKFVEVCHIKPLRDFENTNTVREINNIDNLIGLCPNCHWEMDNMQGDQVIRCVS